MPRRPLVRTTTAKPPIHSRDHEHGSADPLKIHYEDVGDTGTGGGGGDGIQFDTDPQEGDWLHIHTTGQEIDSADPEGPETGISLIADKMIDIASPGDGGVRIITMGNGGVQLIARGDGAAWIGIQLTSDDGDHRFFITGLPSSNPGGGDTVWRDSSGFLRIG